MPRRRITATTATAASLTLTTLTALTALTAPAALAAGLVPRPAAPSPSSAAPTMQVALQLRQPSPGAAQALARLAERPQAHAPRADQLRALSALTPATATASAVRAFAAAHGLQVRYASRWLVVLSGPGSRLAGLFGTRLTPATSPLKRGRFYRATAAPHVPAALTSAVSSVAGLDNRPLWRPAGVPAGYGYTGPQLRSAYQVPTSAQGSGVTIATVQFSGWDEADLSTYAQAAGIPLASGQVQSVSVGGASTTAYDGSGGQLEVDLDQESLLAVAPAAHQRVYVTSNSATGAIEAFDEIASDAAAGTVQVVSQSWGDCEQSYGASVISEEDQALARITAAGATVFASSGDSGAYDCAGSSTPAVDYPASSPWVVGVGGTQLTASTQSPTGWSETTWSDATNGYGSGGGSSQYEPRPSWQSSVGIAGSYRLVPDVASDADPNTGFGIYISSGCNGSGAAAWCEFGGTSLAAPTWAAGLADALSAAGRTSGVGDIHALLYSHPQDFHDVTTGNNLYYSAQTGYDEATGLGTPDWSLLGPVLAPAAASSPAPSPSPSPSQSPTPVPPAPAPPASPNPAPVVAGPVAATSSYRPMPLAWRAANGSTQLGYLGSALTAGPNLGGLTSLPPTVTEFGPRLMVGVTGGNHSVYLGSLQGQWNGWRLIGGRTDFSPAIAARGADFYLAAVGLDRHLYLRPYTAGRWGPWRNLGGQFASAPTIAVASNGQVELAGTAVNDAVYLGWLSGNSFSGWHYMAGLTSTAPSIAIDPWTGQEVLAATAGNHAAYVRMTTARGWTGWVALGGLTAASPSVAEDARSGFLTFIRSSSGVLLHRAWTGQGWSGWQAP